MKQTDLHDNNINQTLWSAGHITSGWDVERSRAEAMPATHVSQALWQHIQGCIGAGMPPSRCPRWPGSCQSSCCHGTLLPWTARLPLLPESHQHHYNRNGPTLIDPGGATALFEIHCARLLSQRWSTRTLTHSHTHTHWNCCCCFGNVFVKWGDFHLRKRLKRIYHLKALNLSNWSKYPATVFNTQRFIQTNFKIQVGRFLIFSLFLKPFMLFPCSSFCCLPGNLTAIFFNHGVWIMTWVILHFITTHSFLFARH